MQQTPDPAAMDPANSPSSPLGVRRVNNMPLYIGASVGILFLVVMALVAFDRAEQQAAPDLNGETRPAAGSTARLAQEIAGSATSGIISPDLPPPPPAPAVEPTPALPPPTIATAAPPPLAETPATGTVVVTVPPDLARPPMPGATRPGDDTADRVRTIKLQQLEQAVRAGTTVTTVSPRSAGSTAPVPGLTPTREEMVAAIADTRARLTAATRDDPTAAYQARLAEVKARLAGDTTPPPAPALLGGTTAPAPAEGRSQYSAIGGTPGDRWTLGTTPEAPGSPYELRAGFVVPATLISGINSELPGQIIAQVSQSVYDTATGRHLLIPQGARLLGIYESQVQYGQNRVLVAWQRIIFPDGQALDIGSMQGTDMAGYAGFADQVNTHFWRIFGNALLMSAVVGGISYSQDQTNNNSNSSDGTSASDALSQALGQQLGNATAQMITKNMNIAPTIEIRPGYRFNVIVTKDITLSKPYRAYDY